MSTHASVRQSGGVAIVDVSGPITLGEGTGLVRAKIKELVANGHKDILVNLQNVGYIDSAGLGELVGAYASVSNLGGHIKLLNVAGRVNDLLQVTKLYTVFETFSNEAAALSSFSATATA